MDGLVEPLEDGGFKRDAVIAETVIGIEVRIGDGRAGLLKRGGQAFIGGSEAVVGGEDEDGARSNFGREGGESPGGGVGSGLLIQSGHRGSGERREVGGVSVAAKVALEIVHGTALCDDDAGGELRMLRESGDGHEAAHAVTDGDDAMDVDVESGHVSRVSDVGQHGAHVFHAVGEAEGAFTAPCAAIVYGEDVPSVAAESLREVHILLVSGETMEQEDGGVRVSPRGNEKDAQDAASLRGDHGFLVLCGGLGAERGIRSDGCRLLGVNEAAGNERGKKEKCGFANAHRCSMQGQHGRAQEKQKLILQIRPVGREFLLEQET